MSTFMHTKKNIVLGGDFNFVEDIALDKNGGNLKFGDIGKVEMSVLKRDCGLVDIYRQNNKKERQFSWEGGSGHKTKLGFYVPFNSQGSGHKKV